jgi:hypothetical protein
MGQQTGMNPGNTMNITLWLIDSVIFWMSRYLFLHTFRTLKDHEEPLRHQID